MNISLNPSLNIKMLFHQAWLTRLVAFACLLHGDLVWINMKTPRISFLQGCQFCPPCGTTGCPVVMFLSTMKCVVTVAPYPWTWRYFGPLHLRQKEPLESKIEPLGNYMWIGAIKKSTLSDLGACFWPFLTTFLGIFLTCPTDTYLQGVYKYCAGPKSDFECRKNAGF